MRRLALFAFFFRPYPWHLAGIFAASTLYVLLEAFSTAIVYPMTTAIVGEPGGAAVESGVATYVEGMFSGIPVERRGATMLALFALSYIALVLFAFSRAVQTDILARVVTRDYQVRLFRKYLTSDYEYLMDQKQGTMLFRIITAPQYMTALFSAVPKLVVDSVKLLVVGAILLMISVRLTLLMGGLGAMFYVGLRFVSRRIVYLNSSRMQEGHEQLTVLANEAISGIKEIKIHRVMSQCIERFRGVSATLCHLYVKNDVVRGLPATALQVGFMGCLVAILAFNGSNVALDTYVPIIAVYAFAFLRLAPALAEIASMRTLIAERLPYAEAVMTELQQPSQRVVDGTRTAEFRRAIRFENVSFRYPSREKTLREVTLLFERGTSTALVGPSGSGKTTAINLLVGLFDVDEGAILIDDVDLKEIRKDTWLRKVGYVGQDTFLLNATVAENITFGADGVSQNAIEKAAHAANAHDFISRLPQVYGTVLGDRGVKLSGGQRQRIAIARALLHDPEILIFDEATSALDSVSEAEVQVAIAALAKTRTVIAIAHRLSTIREIDRIYVLEAGRVAESGTHDSLMAARGLYYRLYRIQEDQSNVPIGLDARVTI